MKILLYALALFLAAVHAKPVFRTFAVDTCDPDSWRVFNFDTVVGRNATLITANLTRGKNFSNKLHEVRINMPHCKGESPCREKPEVTMTDVDCNGTNLTKLETDACNVVQMVATKQRMFETMQKLFDDPSLEFCIRYVHTGGEAEVDQALSSEESSEEDKSTEN